MKQKLNIITLGVKNLQKSAEFYVSILGWVPSEESQETIIFFNLGGVILSLYERGVLAEDIGISPKGTGFSGISLSYNAKSPEDVDDVMAQIAERGAKIVKNAQKASWGGYSGYFQDPDGYVWEVSYNPYFAFDEKFNLKV